MTDLAARVRRGLPAGLPDRLGVAVSGGGDSIALLHLLLAMPDCPALSVATVDHGLRHGSAEEAATVAETCAGLGVPYHCLTWDHGPTEGNLQAQARAARYDLLADWARAQGLGAVVLGHTRDDQAETVLMRLGRGAGVTGLAAMRPVRQDRGLRWLRPMLEISRTDLREYLRGHSIRWCDDPSNDDIRFDRIRLRQAQSALDELGLTSAALSDVARNMARAEESLEQITAAAARRVGSVHLGDIVINRAALAAEPEEIARRLILRALRSVVGPGYPPRSGPVLRVLEMILAGQAATLAGCLFIPQGDSLRITRELAPIATLRSQAPRWDRWEINGLTQGDEVAALGERGLVQVPDWRETGAPRQALLASPAVWRGQDLVAAPVAGWANGRRAVPRWADDWASLPQSH